MAGILDWGVLFKRVETKDLTITAVGTKKNKFISFRTMGCYVQVLLSTNNSWTETETCCAAQKPLLIEERTTYAFSMDWLQTWKAWFNDAGSLANVHVKTTRTRTMF